MEIPLVQAIREEGRPIEEFSNSFRSRWLSEQKNYPNRESTLIGEKMMSDTQQLLEEFHQFALGRLSQEENDLELDDLLLQWYDSKESDAINATIRQGLLDMNAGLGKPAAVVSDEMRKKFGFGSE